MRMIEVQSRIIHETRIDFQKQCLSEPGVSRSQSSPVKIPTLVLSMPPESKLRKYFEKIEKEKKPFTRRIEAKSKETLQIIEPLCAPALNDSTEEDDEMMFKLEL